MTVVAPDSARPATPLRFADPAVGPKPAGPSSGGHLPYFPAIEGLRGLAVFAVLLFHSGFTWMQGGYLGVSTFFTLSGFLITSLLLAERGATAAIDLRAFWLRRFRRLMPAALGAMALATVFGFVAADAAQKRNLAGDLLASVGYVANWRFLFSDQSYGDLFAAPSPVLHFWSLAIEEQFYLLYPLLAWLVLQYYGRRRQILGAVLLALTAASLGLTLLGGLSQDAVYFSTATRATELLIGGLLAVAIYHRRVTHVLAGNARAKMAVGAVGAAALAGSVLLWITTPQSSGWLYQGGFTGYALLSAAVILAAITPFGPVRWLLSARPLRELGRISYGVYLYHWPVFLWISDERTGWPVPVVLVARLAVTLVIALLSYRFLEMPVRRGGLVLGRRPVLLAPFAVTALAAAVIAVTITAPKPLIDFEAASATLEQITQTDSPPPPPYDPSSAEPPFPRMAIFGDSTAMMTGLGMSGWATESKQADLVNGAAWMGCGVGRGGERRSGKEEGPIPDHCNHWARTWAQKINRAKPNIAIVQIGPWDVADRKLDGESMWRVPGDPVYDNFLLSEMDAAVETLSARGADVMWLTSPPVGAAEGNDAVMIRGQAAEPARTARLNELINQLPARHPGKVHVIDLAGWLAASGEDQRLRPDGVHFGPESGKEVAARFLGPAIIDAFRADWKQRQIPTGPVTPGTTPGTTKPATTVPPNSAVHTGPRRKVLVLGDESAAPIADALETWGTPNDSLEVTRAISPGCGIVQTTARRAKDTEHPTPAACADQTSGWLQTLAAVKPDIVVIVPSVWDLTDVKLPGEDTFRSFGDPVLVDAAWKQYTALGESLHKTGAVVGWLTVPAIEWGRADNPKATKPYPASDPSRAQSYNTLLKKMTAAAGGSRRLSEIDFAGYAADWPDDSPPLLADGVSVNPGATSSVGAWLGPELLVYFDEYQASGN